jgi:hypothetical protein
MENKTSKNLWRSVNHTNSDEEELLKFQGFSSFSFRKYDSVMNVCSSEIHQELKLTGDSY